MKAGSQGPAFFLFATRANCVNAGISMKKLFIPIPALALVAGSALAANTNAPVIIDANATSAYVNDGSRTNRMSPPVPGVAPLRSLTVTPQLPSKASLTDTKNIPDEPETQAAAAPRAPRTAAEVAEANPNATYRFIDKRPLGMNKTPTPDSVYTLDDVPEDQQRNKPQQSPAALSPAR